MLSTIVKNFSNARNRTPGIAASETSTLLEEVNASILATFGMSPLRPVNGAALRSSYKILSRCYSSASPSTPATSPFAPRHLLSIADLTPAELTTLVRNAAQHKKAIKSGSVPKSLLGALTGRTVAMTFNKRSTRTRISTEAAVVTMGGHPMFLGKDDIQLGV